MFEKKKGEYQYLKKMPVRQGLITLGMLLLSGGVFGLGYFLTKDVKNLLTIVAILGMLPAAKSLVSMIMYMKAERYTCQEKLHEGLIRLGVEADSKYPYGYDFYITAYDKSFPIAFVIVKMGLLIAVTETDKCDMKAAKKHIEEYMAKNGISNVSVKIIREKDKFLTRLETLLQDDAETTNDELAAYKLICNLSL